MTLLSGLRHWLGRPPPPDERDYPPPASTVGPLRLADSIDASFDAALLINGQGTIEHANRTAEAWWEVGARALRGVSLLASIHPDDVQPLQRLLTHAHAARGMMRSIDARLLRPAGDLPWVEFRIVSLHGIQGLDLAVVELVDARARREDTARAEREHEVLRAVFDAAPMCLYVKDLEHRYVSSNRANVMRFGLANEAELIGKTASELDGDALSAQQAEASDIEAIATGQTVHVPATELEVPSLGRRWLETVKVPLHDRQGQINGVLGITTDVSETRRVHQRLSELATLDALTGLPNRRALIDRLNALIETAREDRSKLAVIFCDLDFFKAINDIHGHEFGDQFLHQFAQTIQTRLRPGDWMARFGGDEFVIVCHPIAGELEGYRLATELLDAVHVPVQISGVTVRVDASVGLAFMRADHRRAGDLIRDADAAMYLAKEQGRSRVAIFDDSLHKQALERVSIDQALRCAIDRNEFTLVYQPKVSLSTGKLVGFEALLRWKSRELGMISPATFIPLAEETGIILDIGRWVLNSACAQLRQWQQEFPALDDLVLAVNVSMRQLFQDAFLDIARNALDVSGIYPNALELEITETTAMSNPQQAIEILAHLKNMGLRLALDDFGTGYSSLSHLQRLPIDVIKIDRSFVHGIASRVQSAEIARLVVALSRTLGITTVAEGVETRSDLMALKDIGADIAQGYLFSRPLSAEEARDLMALSSDFIVN